jgi:hypothetical protein
LNWRGWSYENYGIQYWIEAKQGCIFLTTFVLAKRIFSSFPFSLSKYELNSRKKDEKKTNDNLTIRPMLFNLKKNNIRHKYLQDKNRSNK